MRHILLLTCGLLFAIGSPVNLLMATDYFVSQTGNDGNTGLGTGDGQAFRTISHAITVATTVGDTITLGSGTWDTTDDGESFPLIVPDGITIAGAGADLTTVNGEGIAVFRNNGNTNTTIVRGLTLRSTSANFLVRVQDSPDDWRFSSCVFSGAQIGVWCSDNVDTAFGLRLNNNQFTGQTSRGVFLDLLGDTATSGAIDLDIVGNTFFLTTSVIGVSAFMRGTSPVMNVSLASNSFVGGQGAVDLTLRAETSGSVNGTMLFNGNDIAGQTSFGAVLNWRARDNGFLDFLFDMTDNVVTSVAGTNTAIKLVAVAQATGTVEVGNLNCGLMSNLFSGNSGSALRLTAAADTNAVASIAIDLQLNCIASNGLVGIRYLGVNTSGTAILGGNVHRNLITDNALTGIHFDTANGGGSCQVNVFLGNSATAPGYNTIQSNATSTGTEIKLNVSQTALTLPAQCNWWDATSGVVEGLVCDNTDNAALGDIATVPVAPPTLTGFTANVADFNDEGDSIVITSTLATTFIGNIAGKLITVTMGGLPVANLVVFGDTLTFDVPVGIALVDAIIVITNPGGQSGSLLLPYSPLTIIPPFFGTDSSSGICFVATAAFGDADAPEVLVLRRWRDEHLSTHALGRALVRTYYSVSPALARSIAGSETARTASRAALAPLVGAVRLWIEAPWLILLGGGALVFGLLRRRR